VVKTPFLNNLPVEVQEYKLCLKIVPFEKANSQSKYILVKLFGAHNLEHIVVLSIFQALFQILRIIFKFDSTGMNQSLALANCTEN
jgi:hypothetical protein